jgi:hypothetical protein
MEKKNRTGNGVGKFSVQPETHWLTEEIQLQFAIVMVGEMALSSMLVGFERDRDTTEKERAGQNKKNE